MNKETSTQTVIKNLYNYFEQKDKDINSLSKIAKYLNNDNFTLNILKNWSSGRSSPSLHQLNELSYYMSVHPSQLLIKEVTITVDTPIWKDNIIDIFYSNFEKYNRKLEEWGSDRNESQMSYRSYCEILKSRSSTISLNKIDIIAKILKVEVNQLLEDNNEKKD